MDPFTAIGLAGNILQFVDFGCKLFSATHEIYTSTTGLKSDAERLRALTLDLEEFCSSLTHSLAHKATTDDEARLIPLALQCRAAAEKVLEAIARLAPKRDQSRWRSLASALKTVWKQEEIDRMQSQLDGLRMQLMLRLQAMSSSSGSTIQALQQLRTDCAEMQIALHNEINGLHTDVLLLLRRMEHDVKNGTNVDIQPTVDIPVPNYDKQLSELTQRGGQFIKSLSLLKSLQFDDMQLRYSRVPDAHSRTYDWMYDGSFADWTRSAERLYWISGKPGSGKSTLMKYLFNNPATSERLHTWAGARKLMIACYFFWINGNDLQRSRAGLLRSIIFDMLRRWPELINLALESRISLSTAAVNPLQNLETDIAQEWTPELLFVMLERIMKSVNGTHCFCFFIDGLDEYEGDLEHLTDFIRDLQRFLNIKLCLASRPWNVFEAALGTDRKNKIYVQDLTRTDITIFVKDKLEAHSQFQRNKEEGTDMDTLVLEVVDKAQGVFLWVYLVTKSLLEGLHNADRVMDLRRRLRTFPADLNDYFGYILDSLDPIYRDQTARGFQAVSAAPRRLSILHFWYLDHEEEDTDYAINMAIPKVSEVAQLQRIELKRAETMAKRVNGRFRGLLEVTNEHSGRYYLTGDGQSQTTNELKVDFLHRTVKDFLSNNAFFAKTDAWVSHSFQVNESLCKAYIADLKDCCARKECLMNRHHLLDLTKDIFQVSQAHEAKTGQRLSRLLEELVRVVDTPTPGTGQYKLWDMLGKGSFDIFARDNGGSHVLEFRPQAVTAPAEHSSRRHQLGQVKQVPVAGSPIDTMNVSCLRAVGHIVDDEGNVVADQDSATLYSLPSPVPWTGPAEQEKATSMESNLRKDSIVRVTTIRGKMMSKFRKPKPHSSGPLRPLASD